ncbi:MAG TPA: DUF5916 domain-containing protein [Longimicrobiaceae bacterium]|nr:DUF5916 domain-containing protein [Longimicrobiaceae bacterium]
MARPTPRLVLRCALLLLAALAALPEAARAQGSTAQPAATAANTRPARVVRAARAEGIRIDGRLDEAAWATAEPATDFVQQRPNAGQPASERTEARVLFDADAIYVGMRMYDSHPDSILAQLTRRDMGSTSDGARVFIDSYDDRRTAFVFGLNPKGVKDDFLRYDDGAGIDDGWDAVWDGAARVDSAGWVAEFRIPLSQLRFNAASVNAGGKWGLNFRRHIARRAETVFWADIPPNTSAFVSLFGDLQGLAGIRQARRLELLPYTSAQVTHAPGNDEDPFWDPNEAAGSIGADIKAGLPLGLTLSATINPDFSQVEADPAQVNLSAFESFFGERRPFFTEGADIFRFGQLQSFNLFGSPTFFYSRRIGRRPQGFVNVPQVEFTEAPDASTILGAAKVSGKTRGWSVGFMDALTAREHASFVTTAGDRDEFVVEPLTNYFVGRVRKDLQGGRTVLGGMATAVNRDMGGSEFDDLLRSSAYVGGVDGSHTWNNRTWTVSGFVSGSMVNGSESVISAAQRSSARYFNRPDADHVELDSTRTSLTGYSGGVALQRSGSWDLSLAWQEVSPGFETNDVGFQGRADQRGFSTFVGRRVNEPNRLFRDHSYYAYTNHQWNFGGDETYAGYSVGANATFKNLWYGGGGAGYDAQVVSDRLTRGGPLAVTPGGWRVNAHLGTDSRKPISAFVYGNYSANDADELHRSLGIDFAFRPTSFVQMSVGPFISDDRDRDQFVRSRTDALAASTFGRRFVFANVDQTTVSMVTRVDWTFTPTLSLQVYAEPFLAVGDFWGYKELERRNSFDFLTYGEDGSTIAERSDGVSYTVDPDGPTGPAEPFVVGEFPGQRDFTFQSLRGSAVLRWEYRPGSTLFLVWQQDRAREDETGELEFGDDVRDIFSPRARNVFLIKATYWLNR